MSGVGTTVRLLNRISTGVRAMSRAVRMFCLLFVCGFNSIASGAEKADFTPAFTLADVDLEHSFVVADDKPEPLTKAQYRASRFGSISSSSCPGWSTAAATPRS